MAGAGWPTSGRAADDDGAAVRARRSRGPVSPRSSHESTAVAAAAAVSDQSERQGTDRGTQVGGAPRPSLGDQRPGHRRVDRAEEVVLARGQSGGTS